MDTSLTEYQKQKTISLAFVSSVAVNGVLQNRKNGRSEISKFIL